MTQNFKIWWAQNITFMNLNYSFCRSFCRLLHSAVRGSCTTRLPKLRHWTWWTSTSQTFAAPCILPSGAAAPVVLPSYTTGLNEPVPHKHLPPLAFCRPGRLHHSSSPATPLILMNQFLTNICRPLHSAVRGGCTNRPPQLRHWSWWTSTSQTQSQHKLHNDTSHLPDKHLFTLIVPEHCSK